MKVAIIPARGGSKRIPRKNIKHFHGKPIIAYSIEAAKQSGCFDRIIVSTDDQEIADIALEYGAEVPFIRPNCISDDYSSSDDVVKHAIEFLKNEEKLTLSYVCCIYATAPLLKPKNIQLGLELISTKNLSYVFSATEFSFPIQRAFRLVQDNKVEMFQPEHYLTRSQDLVKSYHDAGQFYWGKPESFLNDEVTFSPKSSVVLLPDYEVVDIDTPNDWIRAEILYSSLLNQGV